MNKYSIQRDLLNTLDVLISMAHADIDRYKVVNEDTIDEMKELVKELKFISKTGRKNHGQKL